MSFSVLVPSSTGGLCDRIWDPSQLKLPEYNEVKWYHEDGVCKEFSYKGCGGNNNKFKTEEDCKYSCLGMYQSGLVEKCTSLLTLTAVQNYWLLRYIIPYFSLTKILFIMMQHINGATH